MIQDKSSSRETLRGKSVSLVSYVGTLLIAINAANLALAGVVLQPSSASTDMGEFFPASQTRDQSGLSVGYTSLVDDFDTYIASNPTHHHGFGANIWGANQGVRNGNFDFNLGASYILESFALWNLVDDSSAIRQFELLADDNPSFSSPTSLGSFTASNTLGTLPDTEAEVFTFAATPASFVRLAIANTWGSQSNHSVFGEAAFEVVPEPPGFVLALALLGWFMPSGHGRCRRSL